MIAQCKNGKSIFGLKKINDVYLTWDLEEIESAVKSNKLTLFEVAKKLYSYLLEKNKELLESKEAI